MIEPPIGNLHPLTGRRRLEAALDLEIDYDVRL